jgi:pimeloyl-ACP methyl ester carboxylesterase
MGIFAALIGITALGLAAFAEPSGSKKVPNVVLVHGAWADASSWSAVISRLQKAGYHVAAVQLGLQSFEDDVARTRALVAAQKGPTLVVAHSFGGAVITELAGASNVAGLVYESAFAPDEGESLKALLAKGPPPPGIRWVRQDKDGLLWLDPDGFVQSFATDVATEQARVLAAVQKPIAATDLMSERAFGKPAWKEHPTWYIVTEQDQMVPPDAQRAFAKRMGATVVSLPGASHAAMISHPDEVAALIMKAAAAGRVRTASTP